MKLAVLLVYCSDAPRETRVTQAWVNRLLTHARSYLRTQSGNRVVFSHRVYQWCKLNMTSEQWNNHGFNVGPLVKAQVAAQLGEDLDSYTHFALIIDKLDANYGAVAPGKPYAHIGAKDLNLSLLTHELGHFFFGSGHANLHTPSGPFEYGDRFCVMGGEGWKYRFIHPSLSPSDGTGRRMGTELAAGPGMGAPALLACGWLKLNGHGLDISVGLKGANEQVSFSLGILSGAPAANSVSMPVVAWAKGILPGQMLIIEYRRPLSTGWDRALPPTAGASGWVIVRTSNGSTKSLSSVELTSIPAAAGNVAHSDAAGLRFTIVKEDLRANTVTINVQRAARVLAGRKPASVSWGRGRLDIFGNGTDSACFHKAWNGRWYPSQLLWERLYGGFTSAPAATSWGLNRLDIVSLGEDGGLWHKAWAGQWVPTAPEWRNLDGRLISHPIAVSNGVNRLDIFALGTNRAMYRRTWDGRWVEWAHLGGELRYEPAVVSWAANRLDLFAVGMDAAIWYKWCDDGNWGPSELGWQRLGGRFVSSPAAVSWGINRLDIFGIGTDDALYHKAKDGNDWYPSLSGWEPLGGKLHSAPTVVSWGANRIDIFAIGTDRAAWHKAWTGRGWYPSKPGWAPLGGRFSSPLSAVSWAPNRLDLFGLGTNNGMFHKAWDGNRWYPEGAEWENIGGQFK